MSLVTILMTVFASICVTSSFQKLRLPCLGIKNTYFYVEISTLSSDLVNIYSTRVLEFPNCVTLNVYVSLVSEALWTQNFKTKCGISKQYYICNILVLFFAEKFLLPLLDCLNLHVERKFVDNKAKICLGRLILYMNLASLQTYSTFVFSCKVLISWLIKTSK